MVASGQFVLLNERFGRLRRKKAIDAVATSNAAVMEGSGTGSTYVRILRSNNRGQRPWLQASSNGTRPARSILPRSHLICPVLVQDQHLRFAVFIRDKGKLGVNALDCEFCLRFGR